MRRELGVRRELGGVDAVCAPRAGCTPCVRCELYEQVPGGIVRDSKRDIVNRDI